MLSTRQKELIGFTQEPGTISCSVGSIRSGKTYAATTAFGLNLCRQDKPYLHLLLGRKLRVIEQEILPTLHDAAMMVGANYRYMPGKGLIEINNQRIVVAAGNDKRSLDRIQGLTVKDVLADEATLLPESFFTTGMSRMSFKHSKAWLCCNPSTPLHFLKKKWIDEGKVDQHLNFEFKDNPTLAPEVVARYESMFAGAFRKRMVEGLWYASDGLVFTDYTIGDVPEGYTLVKTEAGMDYGVASPTAVIPVQTWRKGKQFHWHIPGELYLDGGADKRNPTDVEIGNAVFDYLHALSATSLVLDPSALSIRNELLKKPGRNFVVRRAKNDVAWGLRVAGAVLAHKPITISKRAERLLDELDSYAWDPDKPDQPIKANDHACDATRYVILDKFAHAFTVGNGALAIPEGM